MSWTGGLSPSILNLGTIGSRVVSFVILPLYSQGKCSKYAQNRSLVELQSPAGVEFVSNRTLREYERAKHTAL